MPGQPPRRPAGPGPAIAGKKGNVLCTRRHDAEISRRPWREAVFAFDDSYLNAMGSELCRDMAAPAIHYHDLHRSVLIEQGANRFDT
jgi:hypothetical protein